MVKAEVKDIAAELEGWIDESGCVSYAALCRRAAEMGGEYHGFVMANPDHFVYYMDAMLEDALEEEEVQADGRAR